ncbi:MAG: hypothetical protein JNM58_01460 [Xanthomonadaceae bacterium]|nr:hypothetical protein [Xanthomonadaceae bacterium]
MSVIDQGLFKGVAIVIDDQAEDHSSGDDILQIISAIRSAGGHPIVHTALPSASVDLENYTGVAFVVMDWQLWPSGLQVDDRQREEFYDANVEFIRRFGKHRHTPVVIFTNDSDEAVSHLNRHTDMKEHLVSGRLLVKNKAEVVDQVYGVLNEWALTVPSVLTLKTWERECVRAVNELFLDLHDRSPHWPVMLWETYQLDGPSAADDLGRLITRLVASRMNTIALNLDAFVHDVEAKYEGDQEGYKVTLKNVLEGERVLPEARLHADSIAPGDFFKKPGDDALYINVRPECDVVVGRGCAAPDLYLLKGRKVADHKIDIGQYGEINDRDPKFTVFAMYKGRAYCFDFKALVVASWNDWKAHRVGRLLPPFATRLQQRYSAYLQRTGLPTVPRILRPPPGSSTCEAYDAPQTSCEVPSDAESVVRAPPP